MAKAPTKGKGTVSTSPGKAGSPSKQTTLDFVKAQNAYNATRAPGKAGEIKISGPNGTFIPVSEWDFGYGKGVLQPGGSPYPSNVPADPPHVNAGIEGIYNDTLSGDDTTYKNAIGGIQYGEGQLVNDYFGWKPQDAAGFYKDGFLDYDSVMNAGVDPSNPFSKMSLLSRSYQQNQGETKNGYAAGGHIFSGAYGRAKDNLAFNNDLAKDGLYKDFGNQANSFRSQRLTASDTKSASDRGAATTKLNSYLQGA